MVLEFLGHVAEPLGQVRKFPTASVFAEVFRLRHPRTAVLLPPFERLRPCPGISDFARDRVLVQGPLSLLRCHSDTHRQKVSKVQLQRSTLFAVSKAVG